MTMALLTGGAAIAAAQGGQPPPFDAGIELRSPATGARALGSQSAQTVGWQDDFSGSTLNANRWIIMEGTAPGAIVDNHIGYFQKDHLSLSNGYLALHLTQETGLVDTNPNGVISRGAGIYTTQTYGYGTYQWRMRMSSTAGSPLDPGDPVSGSVSAGFIYINNSQTEIDFEFSGQTPDTLFMTNWRTINNSTSITAPLFGISSEFHTYKFVWSRGKITYYVDDVAQATVTTNVPTAPAYFMISHWGSNSPYFGGLATLGTTRYFYIDWAGYTAGTNGSRQLGIDESDGIPFPDVAPENSIQP